jgi:superfamily I DNA/RNA helicase
VDLVLIDEGQDLNRMKQEFCIRLGRRVVLVGDAKQAIYGFAGADVDSIPRMKAILRVNGPLRLTETRRCGKAIVAEANQYVPDFRAHESNCDGRVDYVKLDNYAELLRDGDMVLCRVNAPLVSQALRRIKAGKKAVIRGRDFGAQLKAFVQRLEAGSVPELIELTEAWASRERDKEERKQRPSESRIVAIGDRVDCICAFAEGSATVNDVLAKMDLVFAGKVCPQCGKHYNESSDECYGCKCRLVTPKGVVYSSVHRAKGLEAKRVFILRLKDAPMPHPMAKLAWERVQEVNLCYVAVTRAIEELYWVTD